MPRATIVWVAYPSTAPHQGPPLRGAGLGMYPAGGGIRSGHTNAANSPASWAKGAAAAPTQARGERVVRPHPLTRPTGTYRRASVSFHICRISSRAVRRSRAPPRTHDKRTRASRTPNHRRKQCAFSVLQLQAGRAPRKHVPQPTPSLTARRAGTRQGGACGGIRVRRTGGRRARGR